MSGEEEKREREGAASPALLLLHKRPARRKQVDYGGETRRKVQLMMKMKSRAVLRLRRQLAVLSKEMTVVSVENAARRVQTHSSVAMGLFRIMHCRRQYERVQRRPLTEPAALLCARGEEDPLALFDGVLSC